MTAVLIQIANDTTKQQTRQRICSKVDIFNWQAAYSLVGYKYMYTCRHTQRISSAKRVHTLATLNANSRRPNSRRLKQYIHRGQFTRYVRYVGRHITLVERLGIPIHIVAISMHFDAFRLDNLASGLPVTMPCHGSGHIIALIVFALFPVSNHIACCFSFLSQPRTSCDNDVGEYNSDRKSL